MGSKSNTWFKKLQTKGKAYAMKRAKGNENNVMGYCISAKPLTSRSKDKQSIEDKPMPTGPKNETKAPLPRTPGWQPAPFMNRKLARAIRRA
jgi:hypothetical protein